MPRVVESEDADVVRPRISKRLIPQFDVTIHGVCFVSRRIAPMRWSVIKQIAPYVKRSRPDRPYDRGGSPQLGRAPAQQMAITFAIGDHVMDVAID
jgi:hypothetical protein